MPATNAFHHKGGPVDSPSIPLSSLQLRGEEGRDVWFLVFPCGTGIMAAYSHVHTLLSEFC